MSETSPTCLVCNRTDADLPLLTLRYQGGELYICPFDLPVLIHKPEQLADKLPGIENLTNNT
jgi:hypothetical protein